MGERRLRTVALVIVRPLLMVVVSQVERRWAAVMVVVVMMRGCWCGVTVEW